MCCADDNSIIGDLPVVGANSMIKVLSLSGVGLKGEIYAQKLFQHTLLDSNPLKEYSTRKSVR